ncbi:MAG: 4-hydroxy-3-methylbut-2-enyl diphosphate reductase [Lachnospiraceae bacterium]|nr:4-hydroxy-3-methylbut-2-enyl diphosphate reductase [Lachnospiraceae bacterium]
MNVTVAKTAGFCFGVKRAVNEAYKLVGFPDVYTYGPIIHNDEVVKDLENKGIKAVFSIDELPEGRGTVIIRSHGVSEEEYKKIEARGVKIIDATCPFVKKIHNIVRREGEAGRDIVIIGDEEHPEVKAIKGWCVTPVTVIDTLEKAETVKFAENARVAIVAQTTFNYIKFNELVEIITKRVYDILCLDTVCSATQERQNEAGRIAETVDAMIVIGDTKSSNSRKLYEICRQKCDHTYFIQTFDNLDTRGIESLRNVGITAGASTPDNIIEEVQKHVREF